MCARRLNSAPQELAFAREWPQLPSRPESRYLPDRARLVALSGFGRSANPANVRFSTAPQAATGRTGTVDDQAGCGQQRPFEHMHTSQTISRSLFAPAHLLLHRRDTLSGERYRHHQSYLPVLVRDQHPGDQAAVKMNVSRFLIFISFRPFPAASLPSVRRCRLLLEETDTSSRLCVLPPPLAAYCLLVVPFLDGSDGVPGSLTAIAAGKSPGFFRMIIDVSFPGPAAGWMVSFWMLSYFLPRCFRKTVCTVASVASPLGCALSNSARIAAASVELTTLVSNVSR